ncbi:NUDIX domain-containing protein [Candidatus Uhrbacteria bacterium]|nr:NUDIX domain-containing protein [Candidatus Uhrbacteria bacterium]
MNDEQARFTIGAFAFIFDDAGRVLLCHRRDFDLWNPPGGKVEVHESPWDTVVREVKEEVGVSVAIERLFGIYFKPEHQDIVFAFICRITDGTLAVSNEVDEFTYFDVAKLPKNLSPRNVERIYDALLEKEDLIVKKQLGPSSVELLRRGMLQ